MEDFRSFLFLLETLALLLRFSVSRLLVKGIRFQMGGKLELVHPNVGACNPSEKGARIYLLKGHPNEPESG
ncbi:hypothetical protein P8452_37281 [Trifolium repens]|nr:hypothetical protein P8452_37281 [Trifolium repens]